MNEFGKKENIDERIEVTRESIQSANEFMINFKAEQVSKGIDLLTYRINMLMKQMFLAATTDLKEYDFLKQNLLTELKSLNQAINSRFGKIKKVEPSKKE